VIRDAAHLDGERLEAFGEQVEQVEPVDENVVADHDLEHLRRAVGTQQRQARGPDEALEDAQLERRAGHDPPDTHDDAARVRDEDVGVTGGEGDRDRIGHLGSDGPGERQSREPRDESCSNTTPSHTDSLGTADARRPRCDEPTGRG